MTPMGIGSFAEFSERHLRGEDALHLNYFDELAAWVRV